MIFEIDKQLKIAAFTLLVVSAQELTSQSYNFVTAGAIGNFGPTQAQLQTAYASTNLNGLVQSNNGIQSWSVPHTGVYKITAIGASGGGEPPLKSGGKGALISGEFTLTAGAVLNILVGQQGSSVSGCYGGGGGSFISTNTNSPLIVAGGGGGAGGLMGGNGVDASIGQNGTAGVAGGSGGSNGNGGLASNTNGGSGGGFFTDGTGIFYMPECSTTVGRSFVNGGSGGQFDSWEPGGFGGGGSAWSGNGNGGGGGGYSGGGTSGSYFFGGGGGGSFNSGSNQIKTPAVGCGDGTVTISFLKPLSSDLPGDSLNVGTGSISTVTNSVTTLLNEVSIAREDIVKIFPNPSSGIFNLILNNDRLEHKLNVFACDGRLVYENHKNDNVSKVDLSLLPAGVYIICIENYKPQKIIIDHSRND